MRAAQLAGVAAARRVALASRWPRVGIGCGHRDRAPPQRHRPRAGTGPHYAARSPARPPARATLRHPSDAQAHDPRLTYRHLLLDRHSRTCIGQCLFLDALLFRGALTIYEVAPPTTTRHTPSPPRAPSMPPIRPAQVALPALIHTSTGVSLADDWRYEWAVLLLWTVPAYVVCEIISTSWHYKMASRMSAETASAGPTADAATGGGGVRGGGGGPRSLGTPAVLEIVYSRLVYVAFLLQAS